jgi:hypothetical protein
MLAQSFRVNSGKNDDIGRLGSCFVTVYSLTDFEPPMRNISLSSYTIEARKRNARKLEDTDDLEGEDLLDLFEEFLTGRRSASNDKNQKMLLRVQNFKRTGRSCHGIIETGEYGYSSELINVDTFALAHLRKPEEAGMLPFFFQIYLPEDESLGLLILQRFGNIGIRGVFAKDFKAFFEKKQPEFSVAFKPIVHPGQLGAYSKHGVVKRLTFRQLQLPKDIADAYAGDNPEDIYVEYSIVAKRYGNLPVLKQILRKLNDKSAHTLHIAEPSGFKDSQILLEVEMNGHTRTIDVRNLNKIRAYFDITDRIKFSPQGHPTFRSVLRESKSLIDDIWRSLRGS